MDKREFKITGTKKKVITEVRNVELKELKEKKKDLRERIHRLKLKITEYKIEIDKIKAVIDTIEPPEVVETKESLI